jgi:hypothetical protein
MVFECTRRAQSFRYGTCAPEPITEPSAVAPDPKVNFALKIYSTPKLTLASSATETV